MHNAGMSPEDVAGQFVCIGQPYQDLGINSIQLELLKIDLDQINKKTKKMNEASE